MCFSVIVRVAFISPKGLRLKEMLPPINIWEVTCNRFTSRMEYLCRTLMISLEIMPFVTYPIYFNVRESNQH